MVIRAPKKCLTIGSRGSQLALWQARYVATLLHHNGVAAEVEVIKTTGDHLQTASLTQAGGKGLFTKEIEDALLAGDIDLAVHSLKDLPTEIANGLIIAAIPERQDARDALLGASLKNLRPCARVGTSSGRRIAQLRFLRPELELQPIRGNVDTRIRKLKERQYDALVLAAAGLLRLGLQDEIAELLEPAQMCPAAGQGALAIETRIDDPAREICRSLQHEPSAQTVACERAALAALGGGCQLPIGAFAEIVGDRLQILGVVIAPDGSRRLCAGGDGPRQAPEELGQRVARDLIAQGAGSILAQAI